MKKFHAGIGLKKTIKQQNMTQFELADRLGLHRQGIWQYTKRESLSTDTIVKCANVLGVAPSEIVKNGEV